MAKSIDLNLKKERVSDDHLKELQTAVNRVNGLQFEIGKIETQKHSALHAFAEANDEILLLQNKLEENYGTFDVNLKDGTINWPDEE